MMTSTPASAPLNLTLPIPPRADWAPILAGEALVCGLLSRLLYKEPERAWLQSLADEGVFDDIPFGTDQPEVVAGLGLLQQWSQSAQAGLSDDGYLRLQLDYTRLFLGPGKLLATPWESAQLTVEHQLFQGVTLQVRQWYRRYGLEAEHLYTEPDDHIGLELAFLAHLAQRGLEALARHGEARSPLGRQDLNDLLSAQRDFVETHPQRWFPLWCDQVEKHARTEFYRGVGRVTRGVLTELVSLFGLPLVKEIKR